MKLYQGCSFNIENMVNIRPCYQVIWVASEGNRNSCAPPSSILFPVNKVLVILNWLKHAKTCFYTTLDHLKPSICNHLWHQILQIQRLTPPTPRMSSEGVSFATWPAHSSLSSIGGELHSYLGQLPVRWTVGDRGMEWG
jgi:hypothetical protein